MTLCAALSVVFDFLRQNLQKNVCGEVRELPRSVLLVESTFASVSACVGLEAFESRVDSCFNERCSNPDAFQSLAASLDDPRYAERKAEA